MTINYNVTGSERKRLVQAISEIMLKGSKRNIESEDNPSKNT